ncbi:hypothetical protein F4824DRAFT_502398 [Ustulina deusta]|nr:hypothetical protein F4824DRAFT_502398 [Ustulina deusta]
MARRLQPSLAASSAHLIGLPPTYHHPKICDQPAAALLLISLRESAAERIDVNKSSDRRTLTTQAPKTTGDPSGQVG